MPFAVGQNSSSQTRLSTTVLEGNGEGNSKKPSAIHATKKFQVLNVKKDGCRQQQQVENCGTSPFKNVLANKKILKNNLHQQEVSANFDCSQWILSPNSSLFLFVKNHLTELLHSYSSSSLNTTECRLILFTYGLTQSTVGQWPALLLGSTLYFDLPTGQHISKEAFINLLEYCEERLKCINVVAVLRAARPDCPVLARTLHYFGFNPVPPSSPLVPASLSNNTTACKFIPEKAPLFSLQRTKQRKYYDDESVEHQKEKPSIEPNTLLFLNYVV